MSANKDTSAKTFESLIEKDTVKKSNTFSEGDAHGHNPDIIKSSTKYLQSEGTIVNPTIIYTCVIIILIIIVYYVLKDKFIITVKKKPKPPAL